MISRQVQLYAAYDGWIPLNGELWYDEQDPTAVSLDIHQPGRLDDTITWTFARSLLVDGVRESSDVGIGTGDVQIQLRWETPPGKTRERFVMFTLIGIDPNGVESVMWIAALHADVLAFVRDITARVSRQREALVVARQLDAAIAQIMAQTW